MKSALKLPPRALVLLAIGSMLASCAASNDTLTNLTSVPPSADFRTCAQLVAALQASIKRQEQLEDLEKKAGSGAGGAFARASYGPEYLKERGNEVNMRHSVREKGCQLPADMPPLDRS